MAPTKVTRTRLLQKEKEERDINKYLRKRLAWCNETGQTYDESKEQYSLLPRALADINGNPHKGNTSNWTEKLHARYNLTDSTPFSTDLSFVPEVAIIDAMFCINVNPLQQHKTLEQYGNLILRRFVIPYYQQGTQEVHLVFDHPGRLPFNPKECEQTRRYGQSNKDHNHITLTPHSNIPRPWRDYLECRKCKRTIVETLVLTFARIELFVGQLLILSGCFSNDNMDNAWVITEGSVTPQVSDIYKCNALEADSRVWRHAAQTQCNSVLIYSPDTDVYNIGLTQLHLLQTKSGGTVQHATKHTKIH